MALQQRRQGKDGFSRTGFDESHHFRVYHQGGLDYYCAIYSIFNLINYLKWRNDYNIRDHVGHNDFNEYLRINRSDAMLKLRWHLNGPGVEGCETDWLCAAIDPVLSCCGIQSTSRSVENAAIPADAEENRTGRSNFRIGIEEHFARSQPIMGFACVMEGELDALQHWVVLVEDFGQSRDAERGGLVLDSDRGYKRWTYAGGRLKVFRSDNEMAKPWIWLSSFIAVQTGTSS